MISFGPVTLPCGFVDVGRGLHCTTLSPYCFELYRRFGATASTHALAKIMESWSHACTQTGFSSAKKPLKFSIRITATTLTRMTGLRGDRRMESNCPARRIPASHVSCHEESCPIPISHAQTMFRQALNRTNLREKLTRG